MTTPARVARALGSKYGNRRGASVVAATVVSVQGDGTVTIDTGDGEQIAGLAVYAHVTGLSSGVRVDILRSGPAWVIVGRY
jgi:hypothetical protein